MEIEESNADAVQYVLSSRRTASSPSEAPCPTNVSRYAPQDADDVLKAEDILHIDLDLPLPLVWRILEDAEYWVRSVGLCGELTVRASDGHIQESLCCTVTIPPFVKDYRPLRRIVFTIEAHDQGAYQAERQCSCPLSQDTVSGCHRAGSQLRARTSMIFSLTKVPYRLDKL